MPQMSKVELYAAIGRDHRAGLTMRELERKYNVAWRTVRQALGASDPGRGPCQLGAVSLFPRLSRFGRSANVSPEE